MDMDASRRGSSFTVLPNIDALGAIKIAHFLTTRNQITLLIRSVEQLNRSPAQAHFANEKRWH